MLIHTIRKYLEDNGITTQMGWPFATDKDAIPQIDVIHEDEYQCHNYIQARICLHRQTMVLTNYIQPDESHTHHIELANPNSLDQLLQLIKDRT